MPSGVPVVWFTIPESGRSFAAPAPSASYPLPTLTWWKDFEASPKEFYDLLDSRTRSPRREIPKVQLSRAERSEGSFVSAKREYLRVEHELLTASSSSS